MFTANEVDSIEDGDKLIKKCGKLSKTEKLSKSQKSAKSKKNCPKMRIYLILILRKMGQAF